METLFIGHRFSDEPRSRLVSKSSILLEYFSFDDNNLIKSLMDAQAESETKTYGQ